MPKVIDPARWEQIQSVFHDVLELDATGRQAFLQAACGQDEDLFDEVSKMLRSDAQSGHLLDHDLKEIACQVIEPSAEFVPAYSIGPYRLKRFLGEGGMGVVWLAEREDAGNEVAIKFLLHAGLSPARRERFAGEVRTLAKLNHRYIARMYDAGTLLDGTPWLVMEYVEGTFFSAYYRQEGQTADKRLLLFRCVCEAVQYAHGQLIVHRDLKPSNIMVMKDGTPKLLDFGIARELEHVVESSDHTAAGPRFMSYAYAAPEWKNDGIVGASNDVYSLGVLLYEMLTGHQFSSQPEGVKTGQLLQRPSLVANRIANPGGLANTSVKLVQSEWAELDVLCLKAMHHDPAQRYPSVEALIRDIDHYLHGQPLEARPDTALYRARKFVRRNRFAVLAASTTFALIVFLTAFFTWRLTKARNAALVQAARTERIQRFMLNLFQGDDAEAGPGQDLRVVTLIDRGVPEAQSLSAEPEVQAELYQTLGTMYMKLGKFDRADTMIQSALKLRREDLVPDPSALAETLIADGRLRSDQGKYDEAERLVREALAILVARDPKNKVGRANALSALGHVLVEHGKYAPAVEVLDQAVAIESQKNASSGLLDTLNDLADAHLYLGHYPIAEALDNRALTLDRAKYGDNHPRVGDDLHDLSQVEDLWGKYADAERHERQALQISQVWYGTEHPKTATAEVALASTLIYESNYSEAKNLLNQALQLQQTTYGNMSPHVAYVLNSLASVENHKKNFSAAEKDFVRMAEIYRAAYGDADYRVATALSNLASVYVNEKRLPEAERLYQDVIQRYTRALSADNINTAIAQIKLGRVFMGEDRYRDAEPHTRIGYEILVKQQSPSSGFVQGARHDLAIIYGKLGEPEKARIFEEGAK
jgi:eukaryotic-like serine/threonine-protein kinase